jgi:hypothetical protein
MEKNKSQFEHGPGSPPPPDWKNPSVTFEEKDVRVNAILVAGLGLLVMVLLAVFISDLTYHHLESEQRRLNASRIVSPLRIGVPSPLPPEPRLQGSPGHPLTGPEELKEVLGAANRRLNSVGWVDQKDGIAHIPIQEAMKLIAERGLPELLPVKTAAAQSAAGRKQKRGARP